MCHGEGDCRWEERLNEQLGYYIRTDVTVCDSTMGKTLDPAKVKVGRDE